MVRWPERLPSVHIFILIFILNRFKTSVFHKKWQIPFKNADLKHIRCKISDVLILGRRGPAWYQNALIFYVQIRGEGVGLSKLGKCLYKYPIFWKASFGTLYFVSWLCESSKDVFPWPYEGIWQTDRWTHGWTLCTAFSVENVYLS